MAEKGIIDNKLSKNRHGKKNIENKIGEISAFCNSIEIIVYFPVWRPHQRSSQTIIFFYIKLIFICSPAITVARLSVVLCMVWFVRWSGERC